MTAIPLSQAQPTVRILVLNPNSSHEMTHGVEEAIRGLHLPSSIVVSYYTAPPASPASINDAADLAASTAAVLADLTAHPAPLQGVDAVLVACFSVHPLVARLAGVVAAGVLVQGLFEASILTAFSLLPAYAAPSGDEDAADDGSLQTWGIVTTGKFWEAHLTAGVSTFLGLGPAPGTTAATPASKKFAGVFSTGLDAGDFHGGVPPDVIRARLKEATNRLLSGSNVQCVVMGCAGMAGLEAIIRDAAREKYGEERGNRVYIVDGTKAGVGLLDQSVRNMRAFQT